MRYAAALLFIASLSISLASAAGAEPERPNVVFILTDDMGWGDVGCYGNKVVPTKNIDRLAAEGLRFSQFYSASPICSPSRVGITTGMDPSRWQILRHLGNRAQNRQRTQADFLDPKAPSLARAFKEAGYATGHFGKWHMGGGRDVTDAPTPSAYGFDDFHLNFQGNGPRIGGEATKEPALVDGREIARHQFTEFWVDKTIAFLKAHKQGPFFVNLWPMDVHEPFMPSSPQEKKFASVPGSENQRRFFGVLEEYDRQIGRVLDAIHELGLDDKTIVVFTSDNGPNPSFDHSRTAALRGQKWSLYEGGIREPFIVRWTGKIPAGRVDDTTVLGAVDMFPTLCGLCGVKTPADVHLDGEDLSAALLGKPAERSGPLYWDYGRNEHYLYPPEGNDRSPSVAVRDGPWKLLVNPDGSGTELYNIATDVKESKNVAAEHAKIVKTLKAKALEWRKSLP